MAREASGLLGITGRRVHQSGGGEKRNLRRNDLAPLLPIQPILLQKRTGENVQEVSKKKKYGHVQAQCPEQECHCGLCAEVHPTWECTSKETRDLTVKCANCKGPHKASSDNCVIRQQETARARHAVMENNKRGIHRVPNYLQEKMKQSNIEPTPREVAKLTATKKQRQTQEKAAKKTAAKGKKAQQASQNAPESASAPAQEPAPESRPELAF
jgi:hypothetical protein